MGHRNPRWIAHVALVLLAVTAAAGPAAAQPAAAPRGGRGGPSVLVQVGVGEARLIESNATGLGVAAETVEAVKQVASEGRATFDKRRAEISEVQQRLDALLKEDLPDEEALLRETRLLAQAWAAALEGRMRTSLEIRKLLTADQRKKLTALRNARRGPVRRAAPPPGAGGQRPQQTVPKAPAPAE